MQVQPVYPDAEQVALDLLESIAPTYTALPADLSSAVIRVERIGGATDLHEDLARIDVECYAPDRATAWANAQQAVQVVLASRSQVVNGVLIDEGSILNGPQQPYYSQEVFRVLLEISLQFRRPRGA